MIVGSKISCMGIVGDGCGGGREFIIKDGVLLAYDPTTKEETTLLENIHMPRAISKKGCLITIECKDKTIEFDLSSMQEV
ncbi:MAG: thiamine biosynthesis protein ThiF [Sulfurimonas sp.]|nr:thiamine biosynthesis protein ThiF [Sulfurimonas sp.]